MQDISSCTNLEFTNFKPIETKQATQGCLQLIKKNEAAVIPGFAVVFFLIVAQCTSVEKKMLLLHSVQNQTCPNQHSVEDQYEDHVTSWSPIKEICMDLSGRN